MTKRTCPNGHPLDELDWCDSCDRGLCAECGRYLRWDEPLQQYVHLTEPERGCFLHEGVTEFGMLMDYATAEPIRPATKDELAASVAAAKGDGGAGVILDEEGRRVYVA